MYLSFFYETNKSEHIRPRPLTLRAIVNGNASQDSLILTSFTAGVCLT